MEESAELFRHRETGEIYAIRRKWNGELVGSAGPLTAEDFKDIKHILTTPDLNHWIEANAKDLILYDYDFEIADELQETWQYIKELTESLYESDKLTLEIEYSRLYDVIKWLKPVLAMMEMRARQNKECIERRLAIGN
ncbi:MAG: hypothetical protein FVQ82_02715 [Planctomycetes bacterium]|nr:hypothetical protein [Planctomycetota bacterium]